ncbi:ribonuclease H-like domain-containing protein [Anaerococcus marasmi]|uniref:ribonuclease H-like domain-containing protein n=1 Tax=Anaerococcus marasmi TaxID=2057797 RepID=UPI000CF95843|nr:ribonuclease H-like domain-containing protein [Anaerococcus marasmi]
MITLKKRYKATNLKDDEIILDIETTGLDSSIDSLVLLGIIEKNNNEAYIYQYFAIDDSEEQRLLEIYKRKISEKKIITYNGDTFDIPFLNNRLIKHRDFPLLPQSLDLLKLIRPYNKFFGFESLKLNDIEKLAGFYRNDPSRYKTFSKLTNDLKRRTNPYPIMKHNENDLIATEKIVYIEKYFEDKLSINSTLSPITLLNCDINNDVARISLRSQNLLKESYFNGENYELIIKDNLIIINLQVLYGILAENIRGYVSINNFKLDNKSTVNIDNHFLIIRENFKYNYENILALAKKIIENQF